MADYPPRGLEPWDDDLKEYIDDISVNVSHAARTLSSADPVVPALSNVNEWTVTDAVQVVLPSVNPGAQYTVHVKSGFQDLTWPALTQIVGATSQDEAWVTLIRGDAGWIVLVPSAGGGSGLIDTGVLQAFSMILVGENVSYTHGDASMLGTGWTAHLGPGGFGGATATIRRSGNQMLVSLLGFKATATAEEVFLRLPAPTGLSMDTAYRSVAAVGAVEGVHRTFGVSVRLHAGNLEFSSLDLTEGLTFGRSPVGVLSSATIISIPINPTSTWGV